MFKKLKSIFIVEDENAANSPQTSPEEKPADQSETPQTKASDIKVSKPAFDPGNPPGGEADEKFVNRLLGAIEENDIDGFDYLEFKQALMNLSNVEMDEATKFKSAMAMAQTMGATKEILFSSAQHYLKVLGDEEAKFLDAFKNQVAKQVNSRNDEIKSLENGIALKKKQIAELQKEIEAKEQTLQDKKATAEHANAKVEKTKDSFYHAYHTVVTQINADVDKMKKYLG